MEKFIRESLTALVFAMVVAITLFLPISAKAESSYDDYSQKVTYSLDETTGTLTITGTGMIPDGIFEDWNEDKKKSVKNVIISEGITNTGYGTFLWFTNLKKVSLPNTLKTIGYDSFGGCCNLKNIDIPKNVTSIEMNSFRNSGLISVTIPNGVTKMEEQVFSSCDDLESVYLPKSLTELEGEIFFNCGKLKTIVVDKNNLVYDSRNDCNAIIETKTNTLINGCNTATIPNGVVTIREYAFSNNGNVSSIIIPKSVTKIENNAFRGNVTSIIVDKNNRVYDSRDNCNAIIETKTNTIIKASNNAIIPDTVKIIGERAFSSLDIVSVFIPDNVTRIDDNAFAFCAKLKDIRLSNKIEKIGDYTFYKAWKLESVIIPNKVTYIGECAFCDCEALKSVLIPDAVNSIGDNAFLYSNNINKIFYTGTQKQWNKINKNIGLSDSVKIIYNFKQKKQTISVSKKASKTVIYKASSLKKKSASFNISAKAKGAISYKVTKGNKKYISVNSSGKVTLKKGIKKGAYKITVIAQATSNGEYKKASKVIVIKIK